MRNYIVLLCLSLVFLACSKEDDGLKPVSGPITYGEMKDERDGAVYKTIQIGDQVWMAENLRYRIPSGSLGGCYTFGETAINWVSLAVNKPSFVDSVKNAISRKEIVDPPGLPIAQQPVFIINMNINAMTPTQLMNRLVGFPAIVAVLNRINENLKIPASISQAKANMATAESQNGQYAKTFGLLYTYHALKAVAPQGWRIPTDEDWKKLEAAIGMSASQLGDMNVWRGDVAPRLIQAEGNESIGFNAQLGGGRVYGSFMYGTPFINRAVSGYYWSSSIVQESDSTQLGIIRQFMRNNKGIWRGTSKLEAAYHIKCIKEN